MQIRGTATRLSEDEYPEAVNATIDALDPPMSPYTPYKIEPRRVYAPIIDDGVNKRVEVDMD